MKTSDTVVFFGSGPVAAEALRLLAQHASIEAVVTKPKPAHHKGEFPVLRIAEQLQLPVVTAANKQELSEQVAQSVFKSRAGVLVDFGIIVRQDVIDAFPLGIVNSHFSLLPEWRGADPITFSILSGQSETGISLMLLVEALDEGPVLAQAPFEIAPEETTPSLTQALIELSDHTLQAVLPLYLEGKAHLIPQEQAALLGHEVPSYSRKLTKDDGVLNFTKPAEQLEREVRAFIEWPKSRTALAGQDVVITKSHTENGNGVPGSLFRAPKKLGFYTAHDIFVIDSLKPAGKSEMTAQAFLAGYSDKL